MPISVINGIGIYSEWHGEGAPVVLVHGSWGDHHNWDPVVPGLARTFRTLTYDRRGHSQSERPASQGSIEEDAADLALLITAQQAAPAHIVGNSFGGSIALKLAVARPDLFASLTVHEPPLVGLFGDDPALPAVQQRTPRRIRPTGAALARQPEPAVLRNDPRHTWGSPATCAAPHIPGRGACAAPDASR